MKNILLLALILAAYSAASAHSHPTTADRQSLKPKPQTKAATKAATAPASAAAKDDSANYVGTNDFYLALVREGIRKA